MLFQDSESGKREGKLFVRFIFLVKVVLIFVDGVNVQCILVS